MKVQKEDKSINNKNENVSIKQSIYNTWFTTEKFLAICFGFATIVQSFHKTQKSAKLIILNLGKASFAIKLFSFFFSIFFTKLYLILLSSQNRYIKSLREKFYLPLLIFVFFFSAIELLEYNFGLNSLNEETIKRISSVFLKIPIVGNILWYLFRDVIRNWKFTLYFAFGENIGAYAIMSLWSMLVQPYLAHKDNTKDKSYSKEIIVSCLSAGSFGPFISNIINMLLIIGLVYIMNANNYPMITNAISDFENKNAKILTYFNYTLTFIFCILIILIIRRLHNEKVKFIQKKPKEVGLIKGVQLITTSHNLFLKKAYSISFIYFIFQTVAQKFFEDALGSYCEFIGRNYIESLSQNGMLVMDGIRYHGRLVEYFNNLYLSTIFFMRILGLDRLLLPVLNNSLRYIYYDYNHLEPHIKKIIEFIKNVLVSVISCMNVIIIQFNCMLLNKFQADITTPEFIRFMKFNLISSSTCFIISSIALVLQNKAIALKVISILPSLAIITQPSLVVIILMIVPLTIARSFKYTTIDRLREISSGYMDDNTKINAKPMIDENSSKVGKFASNFFSYLLTTLLKVAGISNYPIVESANIIILIYLLVLWYKDNVYAFTELKNIIDNKLTITEDGNIANI